VQSLSEKRPYIFLGCFVVGMLVTPPDVISQTVLALPMYLLFEMGVMFSRTIKRRDDSSNDNSDDHSDEENSIAG
jgi:sec-independent protein translocase protein TatC